MITFYRARRNRRRMMRHIGSTHIHEWPLIIRGLSRWNTPFGGLNHFNTFKGRG